MYDCLFKKAFTKSFWCKSTTPEVKKVEEIFNQDSHEREFVEAVIKELKEHPEVWTSIRYGNMQASVRNDRDVVIMIEYGNIILPFTPKMTKEQTEKCKKIIEPIVKRDSEILIKKYLNK